MPDDIIRLTGISKSFYGVRALSDVDFTLKKGEVHGLVGENGAGKTTLINVLYGLVDRDGGDIEIKGTRFKYVTPQIAKKIGIAVIPQRMHVVPFLSVAENLYLNNWHKTRSGFINWRKIRKSSETVLDRVGLSIDPMMKISDLSYVDQQMITIAKMLFVEKADIIVLDEPTAPLVDHEIKILFKFINNLKSRGVSFIYVSHYLDEIFKICDRVTVLRDGRVIGTEQTKDITMGELVRNMVGEEVDLYPSRSSSVGDVVLDVRNFRRTPILKNVSFSLHRGEILGIAGLKGSGRTELARALCGLDRFDGGEIAYRGEQINIKNVRQCLDLGIGYLPEDRIKWGVIIDSTIRENITLSYLRKVSNSIGLLKLRKEKRIAGKYIEDLSIKTKNMNEHVSSLSGGNQQKVVISKLLGSGLDVFVFDDPGFGIDVKAKMNIHQSMNDLVAAGKAIILISSDIVEIQKLSDRILILKDGEIFREVPGARTNETQLQSILEGTENESIQ